ncbi:hypothetical protein HHL11_11990 [Ramlibacter sp. G-1-2-2]|uniref:Secretion system X translation initiation factor n=1 Tax=Ramlibacter agri TaxID=2728837 RepID=A0A848H0I4_9BURK|nr:hypothetical protein [Ramlibacter agri]NML44476.1 hypothetical protein [Ramlibacter agri]
MGASNRLMLRTLALGGAGLVTFYVAAEWSRAEKDAVAAEEVGLPAAPASAPIPAPPRPAASAAEPAAANGPAAAASRAVPSAEGQAFSRLDWLPPPPPPAPPPPPPPPAPVAPTAPPLPFTFIGMVENGMGKPQAFLAKGDALLVVSKGELLENNTYRVDSFDANQVVITYLPLSMKQTIDVSGAAK